MYEMQQGRGKKIVPYGRQEIGQRLMTPSADVGGRKKCDWTELRTISLPPPPSLPITTHPPLSVTPRVFHSKLKCHLFKLSYSDPSDHSPFPHERHPP